MLQFRVTHLFGTITKIDGMALASEDGIRLAFHQPDGTERANRLEFDVQEVLIDWSNLDSLTVDTGLLADQVIIRVKSTEPLRDLPDLSDNDVTLETRRTDRDVLKEFEKAVADYRSGRRKDDVDDLLDDVRDFLY